MLVVVLEAQVQNNMPSQNTLYESQDAMVSHPSHYTTSNGIECIDAITAATESLKGIKAVDTANIIKYAWRWNQKGKPIQDVEKIIWYATHLLNELRKEQKTNDKCKDEESVYFSNGKRIKL